MLTTKQVVIVLSSFQSGTTIKRFCARRGIPRSSFYRWRRLVLVRLSDPISDKQRLSQTKAATRSPKKDKVKTKYYKCRIR